MSLCQAIYLMVRVRSVSLCAPFYALTLSSVCIHEHVCSCTHTLISSNFVFRYICQTYVLVYMIIIAMTVYGLRISLCVKSRNCFTYIMHCVLCIMFLLYVCVTSETYFYVSFLAFVQ